MDVLYEESSTAKNASKGAKKYTVLNILSFCFLFLAIAATLFFVLFIPSVGDMIFFGTSALSLFGCWFVLFRWKNSTNVSYDYSFVSGELRISKVVNINKRKLLTRFETDSIIQIGDVDSTSYERFRADPNVKKVICTSNDEASEGKFFMYILVEQEGRKLYVLECREELLLNIMRFAKRTTLDRDYVSQAKKQK